MYKTEEIINASQKNARLMMQENLRESNGWLLRGLVAIHARQTADERQSDTTSHANGVGWSAMDAEFMSSLAKQVIEHNEGRGKYRDPLSPRQMELVRRKMMRYAGQLVRIAKERHAQAA